MANFPVLISGDSPLARFGQFGSAKLVAEKWSALAIQKSRFDSTEVKRDSPLNFLVKSFYQSLADFIRCDLTNLMDNSTGSAIALLPLQNCRAPWLAFFFKTLQTRLADNLLFFF